MLASGKEFNIIKHHNYKENKKWKNEKKKKNEEKSFFNWSFSKVYVKISSCF